jgi:hypothetical protein
MCMSIFIKIVWNFEASAHYFTRKIKASNLIGFITYHKIFVAMRVIAYVIRDDYAEEYPHIDEDTTIQSRS